MNTLEIIKEQLEQWIHDDAQDLHEREYNQNTTYRNLDDADRNKHIYTLMNQEKGQLRLMSLLKFIMETE